MPSLNKAMIIGHLGQDPELRYTPAGKAVANFSIATSENWTDKDGEKHQNTEWHNIVIWGRMAENAKEYLSKGSPVYIEGALKTSSWEDKESGQKRYKTEIVAQRMQFLGSRSSQSEAPRDDSPPADMKTPDDYDPEDVPF